MTAILQMDSHSSILICLFVDNVDVGWSKYVEQNSRMHKFRFLNNLSEVELPPTAPWLNLVHEIMIKIHENSMKIHKMAWKYMKITWKYTKIARQYMKLSLSTPKPTTSKMHMKNEQHYFMRMMNRTGLRLGCIISTFFRFSPNFLSSIYVLRETWAKLNSVGTIWAMSGKNVALIIYFFFGTHSWYNSEYVLFTIIYTVQYVVYFDEF